MSCFHLDRFGIINIFLGFFLNREETDKNKNMVN